MIKLLVSDLDGTLMNHSNQVHPNDLEALRQAKQQGIDLCLASGRMHIEMNKIMEQVGFAAHGVSQNGAFLHLDDGHFMGSTLFEPEIASRILEMAGPYDLVKMICSGTYNYIDGITPATDLLQARLFEPLVVRADLHAALLTDVPCCKFSIYGNPIILQQFKAQLEQHLSEHIALFISESECLDIVPLNVSKGRTLMTLLKHLGLKPEQIACVGDAFNDVSMFEMTPHSFVMHTAHPDVQKTAAHRVNSVAEAVKHILEYNDRNGVSR